MSIKTLNWCTDCQLDCGSSLPTTAYLCVTSSIVDPPVGGDFGFVVATLTQVRASTSSDACGPCKWVYTIEYDNDQLTDEFILSPLNIKNVLCSNCLTDFIIEHSSAVTCTEMRGCINVEDTSSVDMSYDSGTGIISAEVLISGELGNTLTVQVDGLYVPVGGGLVALDTESVDLSLAGVNLSADVNISADAGNLLSVVVDGLFSTETSLVATDTSTIDFTTSGTHGHALTRSVKVSADANNIISAHADGVYATETANTVTDTSTIDLGVSGTFGRVITAAAKISATADNVVVANGDGLFVGANFAGWKNVTDTWTYASATTITVPTDATLVYQKGDKISLVQSATTKYFYVVDVAATLLTITGGSDYTLTNVAISGQKASRVDVPFGFPDVFTWAPTITGFAVSPTGLYIFVVKGQVCFLTVQQNVNTSNATTLTISLPITAAATPAGSWAVSSGSIVDNSVSLTTAGRVIIASSGTVVTCYAGLNNGAWTAAGTKRTEFQIWYKI